MNEDGYQLLRDAATYAAGDRRPAWRRIGVMLSGLLEARDRSEARERELRDRLGAADRRVAESAREVAAQVAEIGHLRRTLDRATRDLEAALLPPDGEVVSKYKRAFEVERQARVVAISACDEWERRFRALEREMEARLAGRGPAGPPEIDPRSMPGRGTASGVVQVDAAGIYRRWDER